MPNPLPWVERSWSFDFPVGVYRDVIERLRGTPARLLEATRSLEPDLLTRRVDDTWSIQENVGHLLDLERLFDGRLEDFLSGAAELRPADMSNKATRRAAHNDEEYFVLLGRFIDARHWLVGRLDQLGEEKFALAAHHPRLEVTMRLVDSCVFQADHDDYHLARITELKRQWGK